MDTQKFITAYNESRNGTDNFYRHGLVRGFAYSDGVKECADAGCHWLLDILATELPMWMRERGANMVIVEVVVSDGKATLKGEAYDDDPTPWKKSIDYTDLPAGEWSFVLTDDSRNVLCILLSEY